MDRIDLILSQWAEEKPGLNTKPMALIGRIKRLDAHLSSGMEATLREYGLSIPTFDVLAALLRSGRPYALTPKRLLETVMVTSGTLTNRIDQLEKLGLIERSPDPEDGRGRIVSLSSEGKRVVEKALAAHVQTQKELVSSLPKRERAELDRLLRRFLSAFE